MQKSSDSTYAKPNTAVPKTDSTIARGATMSALLVSSTNCAGLHTQCHHSNHQTCCGMREGGRFCQIHAMMPSGAWFRRVFSAAADDVEDMSSNSCTELVMLFDDKIGRPMEGPENAGGHSTRSSLETAADDFI